MCRFVLYIGEPITLDALTTRPAHSLIHQSYNARERPEPLNGDGFGMAWYAPEISDEPALYRSTSPAWNDPNLRALARVTQSGCVMAHVRAATPPLPVTQLNCHPFVHGRLALMHNGYIPGFMSKRRAIQRELSDEGFGLIDGSTDSEHLFAMFHDRLESSGGSPSARILEALRRTVADVNTLCEGMVASPHLNVAVSDGRCAVVTRSCLDEATADTLYVHGGKAYVCEDRVCRMVATDDSAGAVIVASEPLSSDPGWDLVPVNHAVVVDEARAVSIVPI